MDKAKIKKILFPRSIAVVGASEDRGKLGYNITENLLKLEFPGEVYLINPKHQEVFGRKSFPTLDSIGTSVDLVLSAVGAEATVEVTKKCAELDIDALVAYAASFREVGQDGSMLERKLKAVAQESGLAVLGPNTPGFINGNVPVNATFFPFNTERGNVAIITQSGGVGGAIYQKARREDLPVGLWIGVGNRMNVDFHDLLLVLGEDKTVRVIGIYMEGTERGEQFLSAVKKVILQKPVVIYKAGRSSDADRLALSHTGSLSGSVQIHKGLFKQAGLIQVNSVQELVCVCKGLAKAPRPKGERIGVITPSGGGSIIIFDVLREQACFLPPFTKDTERKIRSIMDNTESVIYKNPLDLTTTGFQAGLYGRVIQALAMDENVDLILAIFPIHEYFPPPDKQLIEVKRKTGKPVIVYWIAIDVLNDEYKKRRKILERNEIPVFLFPEEAAWAARGLVNYFRIQKENKPG